MHTDIHDHSTRVTDEGASLPDDADDGCDEDNTCGMMAEPNESDSTDACCCC